MFKASDVRWTETIAYLDTHFPWASPPLGQHIETIVAGGARQAISEEIALGSTAGVHKASSSNTSVRSALRALLLCQRVYFSPLWARSTYVGRKTIPTDYLTRDWKARSLAHWGMKSEAEIRSAIAMFVIVPGAVAADVSDVARYLGPPNSLPPEIAGNVTVSRSSFALTGQSETCYRGILAWLLKSGVVSFRWFMQNPFPNGEAALDILFGKGVDVWRDADFTDRSVLLPIEKGFVIHIWMDDTGDSGWNGHWLISNGDGTICGVNNGEVNEEMVLKAYTNHGTLRRQFEAYAERVTEIPIAGPSGYLALVRSGQYARARMVKFNPMHLPNRM